MGELTIGQVARRAGLEPSTLRYYESIGLLPAPQRSNGRRLYEPSILQLLSVIGLAKNAGFTIAEIQTLLHGFDPDTPPVARWKVLALEKLAELDRQLERIKRMRTILHRSLQCGCIRMEDCVIEIERDMSCEA
jgi:MerR family redox-sensitive transcriptional activator SoxR